MSSQEEFPVHRVDKSEDLLQVLSAERAEFEQRKVSAPHLTITLVKITSPHVCHY
jgi:hypothetical protein